MSCEAARMAAELALTTTVGGDMPRLASALPGAKALAGPCRLQLRRLSTGSAKGSPDPAQSAALSLSLRTLQLLIPSLNM